MDPASLEKFAEKACSGLLYKLDEIYKTNGDTTISKKREDVRETFEDIVAKLQQMVQVEVTVDDGIRAAEAAAAMPPVAAKAKAWGPVPGAAASSASPPPKAGFVGTSGVQLQLALPAGTGEQQPVAGPSAAGAAASAARKPPREMSEEELLQPSCNHPRTASPGAMDDDADSL